MEIVDDGILSRAVARIGRKTNSDNTLRLGVLSCWEDNTLQSAFTLLTGKDNAGTNSKSGVDVILLIGNCETCDGENSYHLVGRDEAGRPCLVHCTHDSQKIAETLSNLDEQFGKLSSGQIEYRKSCLKRSIEAELIYEKMLKFSHGGDFDITNELLGPLRILAKTESNAPQLTSDQRDIWEHFKNFVHGIRDLGHLGEAFKFATDELGSAFRDGSTSKALCVKLENLMSVLTECRLASGKSPPKPGGGSVSFVFAPGADSALPHTSGESTGPSVPPPVDYHTPSWRILVVDDHVKNWIPVIRKLKAILKESTGRDVEIDVCDAKKKSANGDWQVYSLDGYGDGIDTRMPAGELLSRLPEYDLVLLDVYLGDAFGIDILHRVRGRLMHTPIIIWSTSTDAELPAAASLANGFLLKKTMTLQAMCDVIDRWLTSGRSRRLWSLPNPFFDHTIRHPALREVALDFTKWTLRYMDCFHAIDDFYFRYFNDHGGRHVIGVMNVVEKLLRPFLLARDEKVLPTDDGEYAREIFSLYIAILCHEYGMFPIRETDLIISDAASNDAFSFVNAMRATHAIRGMAMLLSAEEIEHIPTPDQYTQVDGLKSRLAQIKTNAEGDSVQRVATLVAYHQRLLSLNKAEFLNVTNKALDKFEQHRKALGMSALTKQQLGNLLGDTAQKIADKDKDRLRRQCAIFRLADGLDVDHTRAPADFLLKEWERRKPVQDVEDTKRLVTERCDIDRGVISLTFRAVAPLEGDKTAKVLLNLYKASQKRSGQDSVIVGSENSESDETALSAEDGLSLETLKTIATSWKDRKGKDIQEFVKKKKKVEGFLKEAIAEYYQLCRDGIGTSLQDLEAMKAPVATAASLLVIYEILDEYQAILDVGLEDTIKLGKIEWEGGERPFLIDRAFDHFKKNANRGASGLP
jgi:CheY-like chemotaxis protein